MNCCCNVYSNKPTTDDEYVNTVSFSIDNILLQSNTLFTLSSASYKDSHDKKIRNHVHIYAYLV